MLTGLNGEITKRWSEHQRLRREGALYSAVVRVREIESCLGDPAIPENRANEWYEIARSVQLTSMEVRRASDEAQRQIERLQKMLGTGSKFGYEEILLAITTRVELELFADFCADRGIVSGVNTEVLDDDLVALASSRENSASFRQAQTAARLNWGVPLKSRWLQDRLH